MLFYSYLTKAKLHNMNYTWYSYFRIILVIWKHSLHNKIYFTTLTAFIFCIQNMLFTLKYTLLTKQVLTSTYTKIAQWKMLQQGIISCSRTSICCRFSKKLKVITKLASEDLWITFPSSKRNKNQTSNPPKHSGTKQIATSFCYETPLEHIFQHRVLF